MALTDQELLILDNFMYLEGSVSPKREYDTLGEFATAYLEDPTLLIEDGCDSEQIVQYTDILTQIKDNEKLSSLVMGETTDLTTDNMVRGRCFVELNEDESVAGHVVAFRGTGSAWEAWKDNCEGAYMAETPAQAIAKQFIESLGYNDITVTGHSKGGNMAMYVTAMCGDQILRCVSYDGQGFGQGFFDSISPEALQVASEKITSICAQNDYVNILLTSIAGNIMCVPNEYSGFVGAHSSYTLYKSNEEALNNNGGEFIADMAVDRDVLLEWAHFGLENVLKFLPEDDMNYVADVAGTGLAQVMGENASFDTLVNNVVKDYSLKVVRDIDAVKENLGEIKEVADYSLSGTRNILGGIKENMKETYADAKEDWAEVRSGIKENLDEIGIDLKENFAAVSEGKMEFLEGLKDSFSDLGSGIKEMHADAKSDFKEWGSGLMENGRETMEDAWDDLKVHINEGMLILEEKKLDLSVELNEMKLDISESMEEFGSLANMTFRKGVDGTLELIDDAKEGIKNTIEDMKNGWKDMQLQWER